MTTAKEEPFHPKRILLPTDLSEGNLIALKIGLRIADQYHSQVDVVTVLEESDNNIYGGTDHYNKELVDKVREKITQALKQINVSDTLKKNIHISIRKGRPSKEINHVVHNNFNDLIVIATHGRIGLEKFQYGSCTEEIIKTSKTPVLALKPKVGKIFSPQHILVPVDFSSRDFHALYFAKRLKKVFNSKITVLHVIPDFSTAMLTVQLPRTHLTHSEKQIKKALSTVELEAEHLICEGQPSEEILKKAAELQSDLILIPIRDKSSAFTGLLGMVSDKVVRKAPCDVLTLHPDFYL